MTDYLNKARAASMVAIRRSAYNAGWSDKATKTRKKKTVFAEAPRNSEYIGY